MNPIKYNCFYAWPFKWLVMVIDWKTKLTKHADKWVQSDWNIEYISNSMNWSWEFSVSEKKIIL